MQRSMAAVSALSAGIMVAVMIALNGLLKKYIGLFEMCFIVHFIGFIMLYLYIKLVKRQKLKITGAKLYLYSAGIMGIFIVSVSGYCFNIIGATLTVALSTAGQIILSTVFDHFGILGVKKVRFSLMRIPGFAIIFIGLLIMIRG